jgi:hypothetical protein
MDELKRVKLHDFVMYKGEEGIISNTTDYLPFVKVQFEKGHIITDENNLALLSEKHKKLSGYAYIMNNLYYTNRG